MSEKYAASLNHYDRAAHEVVELGNRLMEADQDADAWEVAAGLLAGAVHFWLYAHQPCGDPSCRECEAVETAEKRVQLLLEEVRRSAGESDYYHSPYDINVGRA